MVVTWTYDPAPRHRSYELLAEAFGWAITKRFSITGCAIEEREYRSSLRLINYLVTPIFSELVLRSAARSVVSLECMFNHYPNHLLSSIPGVFALAVWSIYLLYAALCYPDVLSSVLISAFSACSPLGCSVQI